MLFKASLLLLATAVDAAPHYIFGNLKGTQDWQVVRMTANHYSNAPVTDVTSEAIRCYQNTPGGGGSTSTYKARAGGTITWTANPNIYHPGALSAYMAKVPAGQTAATFDGAGAVWFKVYQDMPTSSGSQMNWPSQNKATVDFKVPQCLADGDYLFRIEHVALHSAAKENGAQFYISCAQLTVDGGSGAKTPTDLVSFPGAYKPTDPGLMINIYSNGGKAYTPAGPAVFKC
ncbi:glycoside hydrolase [Lasiosphaeria ovina]|uniref:lytic cellulose monooxygenase (C4-dehydrogenating) n=1 Tax=Lasiosphaeria ovina TaxID=92902 RepID=A0AAE0JSY4_9PEZI|nr:glycoside hydrolase [Lasiosphaeria ovina]